MRERIFAAILLTGALFLTALNASMKPKEGAPREDALATSVEQMKQLGPGSTFVRAFEAWIVISLGACALVAHRLRTRLVRGEKVDDPLAEPPPWTLVDFTAVFVLSMAAQNVLALQTRATVALDDGRTLELAKPISLGKEVPVPGATGERASIERRGDEIVLRAAKVVETAPRVFVNGVLLDSGERVLSRGDRFDVGGVKGEFRAPTSFQVLAAWGVGSLIGPLLVLVGVRLRGARPRDVGLEGFSPGEALRGAVAYFAMTPIVWLFMIASWALCRALGVPMSEHPLLKNLDREHDPRAVALLVLVAAVIAPISEEILFRGYFLRAMRRAIPSRIGAILAASFFFGAFHPGLASVLPITWVGSVFSIVFLTSKRRSLLGSIVCHSLFNGVNIALEYFRLHAS